MHEQLDALLCTRYPAIFSIEGWDDRPLFGFECGAGWFTLLDATCALIQRHVDTQGIEQPLASQVKEKFGALRFYYRHGDDYVAAVVDLAELLSSHICEVCGARGTTGSIFGWIQTRCPAHEGAAMYDEPLMQAIRDHLVVAPPINELLSACLVLFACDIQAAARWITSPARGLGGIAPIQLIGSDEGLRQVLNLIGRIEHGITP